MSYKIGEPVEIVGGEYAGLGGTVVAAYQGGYEVLIGHDYRLPVATEDLAPDLLVAAREALAYLETLHSHSDDEDLHRLVTRLRLALPHPRQTNPAREDALGGCIAADGGEDVAGR